ncbi:hypothetical protein ACHAWF_017418 [Thalassiosira exigua]
MNRIPEEPSFGEVKEGTTAVVWDEERKKGASKLHTRAAVSWTTGLDFHKLKLTKSKEKYQAFYLQHMRDFVLDGLSLADADLTPIEFTAHKASKNDISIQVDTSPVIGVNVPDLKCVRHTADFDVDAQTVLDVWNRLAYTEAIDKYTYLVDLTEEMDCTGSQFSWAHVEYTADKIMPFFAHRDFVCFDFVDKENLIMISRSCVHPNRPPTQAPRFIDGLTGNFSKSPFRTFRSPLFWFVRTIPMGENKCRVVQFQFSDVGGVVPPAEQTKAAVTFGVESLDRLYCLVKEAQGKGMQVGPNTNDYLANLLLSKWTKRVANRFLASKRYHESTRGDILGNLCGMQRIVLLLC